MNLPRILTLTHEEIDAMTHEELKAGFKEMQEIVRKLYIQIQTNTSNSSTPSSHNVYVKPSPQSQREKTNKKVGGQIGHAGSTLLQNSSTMVDTRVYIQDTKGKEKKMQVVDIVLPAIVCTEYVHAEGYSIPDNATVIKQQDMPSYITSSIQYGPNIKALSVYLINQMGSSYQRVQKYFEEVYELMISIATLKGFDTKIGESLIIREKVEKERILGESLLHVDETGIRVNGKNSWLHVVSTKRTTLLHYDTKRGKEAINNMGIINHYKGILVHDFWKAYFDYSDVEHSMCNAHLLRELQRLIDFEDISKIRSTSMKSLLIAMNKCMLHCKKGYASMTESMKNAYIEAYQAICNAGLKAYPSAIRTGNRGKKAQMKGKNLLDRFITYQTEIVRFFYDSRVPFTNNQAERDIRPVKTKMKIIGSFRSITGPAYFARIMSFISTMRKRSFSVFLSIKEIFTHDYLFA